MLFRDTQIFIHVEADYALPGNAEQGGQRTKGFELRGTRRKDNRNQGLVLAERTNAQSSLRGSGLAHLTRSLVGMNQHDLNAIK